MHISFRAIHLIPSAWIGADVVLPTREQSQTEFQCPDEFLLHLFETLVADLITGWSIRSLRGPSVK